MFRTLRTSAETLPLWVHVVFGSMVLLALVSFVNPREIWTSDEGAVRAQVDFVASDATWSRTRPFAAIDPEMVLSPIKAATIKDDVYHPFTKSPLLPLTLIPLKNLLGDSGLIALSLAGTVIAATGGAIVAGMLGGGMRRTTFWAIALASPLLIYSYMVTAHTVAAAFCTLAFAAVFSTGRSGVTRLVLAMTMITMAVFFRVEAAAFAVAFALVLLGGWWRHRDRFHLYAATGVAAAGILSFLLNSMWALRIAGADPVSEREALLDVLRLARGAFSLLLLLGYHENRMSALALTLIIGAGVMLALTIRFEPDRILLQRLLAGTSIGGAIMLGLAPPDGVTGLLLATPVVVVGLVLVGNEEWHEPVQRSILATSGLLAVLVIATQDSAGGGIQWGGRYLMVAVPLLCTVALAAIRRQTARTPASGWLLGGVVVVASIALSISGLVLLRTQHAEAVTFQATIGDFADNVATSDGSRPVLVSTGTHLGRHMWRSVEEIDFLLVPDDQFQVYLGRFATTGVIRFGFVGPIDRHEAFLVSSGYRVVERQSPTLTILERVAP